MSFKTIEWLPEGVLRLLDQRVIPAEKTYQDYSDAPSVAAAIHDMVVRGAPAIGVTAAFGLALTAYHSRAASVESLRAELDAAEAILRRSRPTAVNLFWALDRMLRRIHDHEYASPAELRAAVIDEAQQIAAEDVATCQQIGLHGMALIPDQATIIHHCNTGSLAASDYGTALGVIRTAHEHGKSVFVLVDETRPRLQGARLTSWELKEQGIPHKIIADGASGHYMRTQKISLCVVGADRIAANGDTANKIGTYNLAVVAQANGVPFYVAAPTTTIDMATPTGDAIEIEERTPLEVLQIGSERIAPEGVDAGNPAFDVTPAQYISGIITEKGVIYPPYEDNLKRLFGLA